MPGKRSACGRRTFLAATGLFLGCGRHADPPRARHTTSTDELDAARRDPHASSLDASVDASDDASAPDAPAPAPAPRSVFALFEAYPALAKNIPRIELGWYPSRVERADTLAPDGRLFVKRDDDFSRARTCPETFELARRFGGGKVRKLEAYLGEARARGARRLITSGGIGSNQALAVARLGPALGFSVEVHLTPQPLSTLTTKNLGADAATGAEMVLFESVSEGHARAVEAAKNDRSVYVIPPGGTTPLGTLGFVSAGLELAADVRANRLPEPARLYVALGLGGSAAGLAIGCALGGLSTEVIAVRTSNPGTVTPATLSRIHDETLAFLRARDATVPSLAASATKIRIDPRFVGGGYGAPTTAGDQALARAREAESWDLDPVYTGKALAALFEDRRAGARGELLFWNTMSSRPVESSAVPSAFQRYVR
ncbi:MAG: pyridoxal-phosphate dependent enzyme [Deltaproteobacteria bacterium]|nr:pyridoxal-phosphate dependent enzyme [Deltaproteobacteria bacterium]